MQKKKKIIKVFGLVGQFRDRKRNRNRIGEFDCSFQRFLSLEEKILKLQVRTDDDDYVGG